MFTRRKFSRAFRDRPAPWGRWQKAGRAILLMLVLAWAALGGGLLSRLAAAPPPAPSAAVAPQAASPYATTPYVTTDAVPERYQLGQQLYFENCATCHIALPPAVMPTETWRDILRDRSHYGTLLPQLPDATLKVMGRYLQTFSRPKSPQEEQIPYRLSQSLYFKALHPELKLPPAGSQSDRPGRQTGRQTGRTGPQSGSPAAPPASPLARQPIGLNSCEVCHPASREFNFRQIKSES